MHEQTFEIKVVSLPMEEELKKKTKALGAICFNEERTSEKQEEHDDQFCSQGDYYKFVLALEDNNVIGSVTILKRRIIFKSKKIKLGGLGGVCTHPDKRRRGIASRLLKVALSEMKKAGCDIAYLCADTSSLSKLRMYGEIGFVPLNHQYTYLGKSGRRYYENNGMIAPINSNDIFNLVVKDNEPFDIGQGNW